jgi:V/A-type H+-transporting ATPase subunit I
MVPLLVNSAEPMTKVKIVTVKDNSEKTLKILQRAGTIHIEESSELQAVDRSAIEHEHRQINELHTYINTILGYLPQQHAITIEDDIEVIYTKPFSEINEEIKRIYNRTSRIQEKIETVDSELVSLQLSSTYLIPLAHNDNLTLRDLSYTGSYLNSRIIVAPIDSSVELRNSLNGLLTENIVTTTDNDIIIHGVFKSRNLETITASVTAHSGMFLNIPHEDITIKEYLNSGTHRISVLKEEKAKLTKELQTIIGEDIQNLVLLKEALAAENDRLSVLEKASEAKYVTVFEGWMPENDLEKTMTTIKEEISYVYIDLREPDSSEEPPTKYRNPTVFKPFQIIVNMFSTPKYRQWDPTPIITYSFAFFFGLMVCDVLYAIGLFLLTRFVLKRFTDDPEADTFKQFQKLLYTCSGVALIGGLLTGQYFGDIYTLFGIGNLALVKGVQEALQDPLSFIIIALLIGFVHINVSHIIAFVKAIKEKDTFTMVGKVGLFLLELGIPGILHSILKTDIPGFTPQIYSILTYAMFFGIVLIFVSSILINKGLGAILWIFDITNLLGDVMSYARLAGVGLATYYLAYTFNLMTTIFRDLLGDSVLGVISGILLSVIIIALGHTINLVLTAITGFMHSLRLCFVEFLFKFYEGGGTEYKPFKLVKRKNITLSITS